MKESNVNLIVKQRNILEKKDEVIFKGIGQIHTLKNLKIYYQETDNTKVKLNISEQKGYLIREGEVKTKLNFNLNKEDQCIVTTDFGDLLMKVDTLEISVNKHNVFLHYKLKEAGAVVGEFQLRLEWKDE